MGDGELGWVCPRAVPGSNAREETSFFLFSCACIYQREQGLGNSSSSLAQKNCETCLNCRISPCCHIIHMRFPRVGNGAHSITPVPTILSPLRDANLMARHVTVVATQPTHTSDRAHTPAHRCFLCRLQARSERTVAGRSRWRAGSAAVFPGTGRWPRGEAGTAAPRRDAPKWRAARRCLVRAPDFYSPSRPASTPPWRGLVRWASTTPIGRVRSWLVRSS